MIPIRDENPAESIPFVTYAILALNVGIFLYQGLIFLGYGYEASMLLVLQAGAVPAEITHFTDLAPPNLVPVPLTLLSSMFMHGGIMHLVGNMLFLWVFGDNVEDYMGHGRFVAFYLGTGLVAALAHILFHPSSTTPIVGASGAISGVLGAYVVLYPRAKVMTIIPIFIFIQIIYLPAFVFIGVWFLLQLLSADFSGTMPGGGVAFLAHIGGFLAGVFSVPLFERKRRRRRVDTYWE